jgi:hypothetical protein
MQGKFIPEMLSSLLEHVRASSQGEPIHVYLVSGSESEYNRLRKAHYEEFIKIQKDLTLKGIMFNPYHLTDETENLVDTIGLGLGAIAGITANGTLIVGRCTDIDFNGKQFSNTDDLKYFLRKNNINYNDHAQFEPQDIMPGFETLTFAEDEESSYEITKGCTFENEITLPKNNF